MTAKITEDIVADDPENDSTHPVPYLRVIDVAAYGKDGSKLCIVVATPLDGSERSQKRLLDKIQGYLGHINSDQYVLDAGVSPTPENTIIEISLNPDSSDIIRGLLGKCHGWIQSHNASLVIRETSIPKS